jgi:hypothetical protein
MRVYLIAESCMQQIAQPERNRLGSPYRVVYDEARVKYADAVHDVEPCAQCGPGYYAKTKAAQAEKAPDWARTAPAARSAKQRAEEVEVIESPLGDVTVKRGAAPIGSPLQDGHKNRRALRAVAKQFLKDLWHEAERLHKEAAPRWN